jgi:class 3 adenylate cyclase/tetratricopeptide (TPR) repeat protein
LFFLSAYFIRKISGGYKMKCSKCQYENPEVANFCVKCGGKLEIICPECHFSNEPGFRFCAKCGHNLTFPSESSPQPSPKDLSFEEKLTKIQRYLPKGLTEKILSRRDRIEGERKQVTVMFCDLEGFTHLTEKLGPEEAYSMMDQVYELLINKVHNYEGTVNDMTGDGIMALFGAPIALEDAPLRAIRSAYSIHREIARFNDRTKKEKEKFPLLKMRIGIHTGPVVVGTLGNDLRVEFKAVGDTVNLASRMEGLAESGTTYVSDDTFKLTEGFFRFEALGEREVKGKKEPVNVFRVIAPSTRRTRFDVSAERGLTPFVGRERALELLLDGFERSKAGRGQAFSIMAEAGVGKSRLLYEFRKVVASEDVTFQEGKCLSYSRGVAYHPIIDIMKSNFDIMEGDGDSEIRKKLKRGLNILKADEASTLPYLLEFLSVKDSGVDTISLSPEARKDRIIESLIRIVLKASECHPLIWAIEDLHWIDKSSENICKSLLDSITGAKIFIIFTYRPEFVHTWGGKSYHSQITLNRLSNRESLSMVTHLLKTEDIDRDLEELILDKTEGVPFFIEEFIKSIRDLKIIESKDNTYHLANNVQAVSIPSTIQDVIMARVDSLPDGAKELLQTGSVIEREFSYKLIKRLADLLESELLSRLSVLKDSELLYERGIYPQSIYIFKHALTQEVVYDSILTRKKKILHEEIGYAIEELYSDNLHEYHGVLVEHFINSDNYVKGSEYCRLAGKKAEKSGSFNEAIVYGNKQVTCLEKLPVDDDVEKEIIDARTKLGLYYIQLQLCVKAKEVIDPIVDLATKRNYKRRVCQINCIIGCYKDFVEEDASKAFEYLSNTVIMGEELNDLISLVLGNMSMGNSLLFNCEFSKALHCHKKALEINEAANSLWGISVFKAIIGGMVYFSQGNIDLGYKTSDEALRIADESGDIFSKAHAYTAHGWSYYGKGYLEKAEKYFLKGASFSERINVLFWASFAHFGLGHIYYDMGKHNESQKHFKTAISLYRNADLCPSLANYSIIALALSNLMGNEKVIDLDKIFNYCENIKTKWSEGWMFHCIGEILLNIDAQHISEAEDWIKRSIETNQKHGMMWNLARDFALYSELFKRKNDLSKAEEYLNQAIEIFKECGADRWVDKYEKELASFS